MSVHSGRHANWVVWLSLAVALMLGIMPLPEWARVMRPEWSLLLLIFWSLYLPERVGVGIAFVVGLCADVLHRDLFGQHSLSFCLVVFLAHAGHRQLLQFPLWQQTAAVMVLLLIHELLQVWIAGINRELASWTVHILPAFTGVVLWPWLHLVMRDLQLRMRVS